MHAWQTILAVALGCHLASAAEWRIQAAPIITGALIPRQQQTCPEATETMCRDGSGGCCPSGLACTFISGKPRCEGGCNGGPTCLDGGCCDIGYDCPTIGGSFCRQATDFVVSAPTATFAITSSLDSAPTETTESRTTGGSSEPTSTSRSTSISESSSASEPSSTSEPTATTTSSSSSVASSSSPGGDTSDTASESSEPSKSSLTPSATESSTGNETNVAGTPEPAPGMAGSLSVSWDSWMALAVMVPFIL
ncbi:hypothetical protein N7519_008400 [Penicillium mononematosum]|uniref:uncharacterized protein n=1 Tax=Penicillium mononematosum TaxID=268346 RepID=UPI00254843C1|nr:uncharacterized protein N7519_008400 [Penicillium mononematosum]KAJ6177939.1 hypothetical protein N7519_008400 [Penicillium mononematosum]